MALNERDREIRSRAARMLGQRVVVETRSGRHVQGVMVRAGTWRLEVRGSGTGIDVAYANVEVLSAA